MARTDHLFLSLPHCALFSFSLYPCRYLYKGVLVTVDLVVGAAALYGETQRETRGPSGTVPDSMGRPKGKGATEVGPCRTLWGDPKGKAETIWGPMGPSWVGR